MKPGEKIISEFKQRYKEFAFTAAFSAILCGFIFVYFFHNYPAILARLVAMVFIAVMYLILWRLKRLRCPNCENVLSPFWNDSVDYRCPRCGVQLNEKVTKS